MVSTFTALTGDAKNEAEPTVYLFLFFSSLPFFSFLFSLFFLLSKNKFKHRSTYTIAQSDLDCAESQKRKISMTRRGSPGCSPLIGF